AEGTSCRRAPRGRRDPPDGVGPGSRLRGSQPLHELVQARVGRVTLDVPVEVPDSSMTGRNAVKISAFAFLIPFGACRRQGESARRHSDSAFAAMQARGQAVMGVDQYASAHVFEDLGDGGRIVLDADNPSDAAGIGAI